MSALTDDQWAAAQVWIGTSEPQSAFQARFNRLGDNLDLAITESLQATISRLNAQPGSLSLPSGLSVTITENIRSWRDVLKTFRAQGGVDGTPDGVGGTQSYKRVRPDVR